MKIKNKIIEFVKKETVLTAAMVLAVLSAVMIPPDTEYIGYIDFRTLAKSLRNLGNPIGCQF